MNVEFTGVKSQARAVYDYWYKSAPSRDAQVNSLISHLRHLFTNYDDAMKIHGEDPIERAQVRLSAIQAIREVLPELEEQLVERYRTGTIFDDTREGLPKPEIGKAVELDEFNSVGKKRINEAYMAKMGHSVEHGTVVRLKNTKNGGHSFYQYQIAGKTKCWRKMK